jgi:hypothetical protein
VAVSSRRSISPSAAAGVARQRRRGGLAGAGLGHARQHHTLEPDEVERLRDVVGGARLERLEGEADVLVGGHHDDESQRFLAAAGGLHAVALLGNVLAQHLAHRLLVVDDPDAAEAIARHWRES